MHLKKDFEYYHKLHNTITHALLYLRFQILVNERFIPIKSRNELLVKFLKPKLNDKALSCIKKDVRLMISTARKKGGNLELKLYDLNEKANQTTLAGTDKLYSLLVYLYDEEKLESRLVDEKKEAEPNVLYMIEDHIGHCFDDDGKQIAPLSMLIQSKRAPGLIDVINQHGWFVAEMKEWNELTHQAHIIVHPMV